MRRHRHTHIISRNPGNGRPNAGARLPSIARLLAAVAVATAVLWPLPAGAEIGVAQTIVHEVFGNSLNRRMREGETLMANQRVRTLTESAADLVFNDGTRLAIGPRAEVRLDHFVYDPDNGIAKGSMRLLKGLLRFAAQKNRVDIKITTPAAVIGIRGTAFDLLVAGRDTEIAVHDGVVEAISAAGSQLVRSGDVIRIDADKPPTALPAPSADMAAAVADMTRLMPQSRELVASLRAPADKAAAPVAGAAWQTALDGREPENLLLMELSYGPVLIELRPDLSPHHAARLRDLVRAGFYDGLAFHNVKPDFVAETGDPATADRKATGHTIAAELTPTPFKRGSVGMKHDRDEPDSANSQFFILYRAAPHLDGNYTYLGDVVYGLQNLEHLQPGSPPRKPDHILRLRVVGDLAK